MTAPTAPVVETGQVQAPVAPVVDAGPKKATDILQGDSAALMERFGLKQLADEGRAESESAPVADATPESPATEDVEPAEKPEAAKPETEVKKDPIAKFQVFDKDGELEIPAITIAFNANGKERKEPLDKVVRLAMQGFYNEEREQQVAQTRQQAAETAAQNEQMNGYVTALRRDLQMLLNDPSDQLYSQLKAEHARANTPEARAERAERALAEERGRGQSVETVKTVAAFSNVLQQHLSELTQAYPEVSFEEVVGRFNTIIAPLMKAGQVPVNAFGEVARLVDQELTPWVQHRHESRIETARQRDAAADEKVARERKARESQSILAKRQIARAVPSTAGTIQQPVRPAAEQPKYKKATDILQDVNRIVQTAG